MEVSEYPVSEIYLDPSFNCRGHITPIDVIDLAKSIEKDGLEQPVVIRERIASTPPQFKYVAVAGHRRITAFKVLKRDTIPAIMKVCNEFQARTTNAIENLKRQDLNLLQEAKTIEHYHLARWTREEIAKELGVSSGWVQVRVMVLELPEEIQLACAAGYINQTQVRELNGLKDRDKQLEAAKMFKIAKEKGESSKVRITKPANPAQKKIRSKADLQYMIEHVISSLGHANYGTRFLAWASGEINDYEIHMEIKKLCTEEGLEYSHECIGTKKTEHDLVSM